MNIAIVHIWALPTIRGGLSPSGPWAKNCKYSSVRESFRFMSLLRKGLHFLHGEL